MAWAQKQRQPMRRTRMKRGSKGLRRRPMLEQKPGNRRLKPIGKQGRLNKKANAQLARDFKGPRYCEATFEHECTGAEQLTWAHNAKRRKKPDLLHAALLCRNAHNIIEVKPPEVMKAIVDGIVAARETALPHAA